jgi:hypothetical protein
MYDADGRLLGVLGIARNITERARSEQQIRGLNRLYQVLSGINEAIVRLRDPDALFREACRIAVERGGFRMAWLGLADPASGEGAAGGARRRRRRVSGCVAYLARGR